MSDFKVGDKVRAIETSTVNKITKGEVYTVTEVRPPGRLGGKTLLNLAGRSQAFGGGVYAHRFELVTPDSEFKKGDRVRVTFEGTVDYDYGLKLKVVDDVTEPLQAIGFVLPSAVEKIEPPVQVFGPGDVVRYKDGTSDEGWAAIGRDGYLDKVGMYRFRAKEWLEREFTSKGYERVN